jgi:hypothetical protein
MINPDFDVLRQRIGKACRQTFDAVRSSHPEERLYAFVLYTVDDAVGINPSTNSEQAYQRAAERQRADEPHKQWLELNGINLDASILGDLRWNPYDWAYECAESDGFAAVNEMINYGGTAIYDENDPLGFAKFQAGVFASMVLGLTDAKASGCFGSGMEADSVTLFCSVANSEDTVWLEEDSARRLNSPAVYQTFAEQRIKWIAEDIDADCDDPDGVPALYRSYFNATSSSQDRSR